MTELTQIQDAPKATDFIVPAEHEAKITQDMIAEPKVDEVVDQNGETKDEVVQTPEQEAAAKAAAREAFARRRAEREARAASQEVEDLKAQVRELAAAKENPKPAATEAPKRPNPADYDLGRWDAKYEADLTAYLDAREAHILSQAEAKALKVTEGLTANQAEAQELHSLNQKGDEVGQRGIDKYADFEEIVQDALEAMPPAPEALKELVQLPNAEDVFYHLAQHPDELDKITAMTPMGQALEFGKISARLASKAKVAQNVTKAKPSPQPPRGDNGKFTSESDATYDKLLKAARNPWI